MTISSPSPMLALPQVFATRLMASVAPRTKTIWSADPAPRKRATVAARLLVGVGRAGRELVGGPVDVGVLVLVEVGQPIDDRPRLLGRRRVVEPHELVPVDPLGQDREVGANLVEVKADR